MSIRSILCMLLLVTANAQAQPVQSVTQDAVLAYLDALTQWQRDAVGLEPSATNAREVVFRDSLRQNAAHVLKSGFAFLRSVASTEPATEAVDPESTRVKLTQHAAAIDRTIARLEASAKTPAVRDALRLEQARKKLLTTILANLNSASNKSPNKLNYTIESLARSIPELGGDGVKTVDAVTVEEPAKRPATSILRLSGELFAAIRKQRELSAVLAQTSELKNNSMALMKDLRAGLGEVEPEQGASDAQKPVVSPLTIDQRVDAYERIGAHIVPLGETMRWIDVSRQTLREWGNVLGQQQEQLLRQLAIYTGILLLMLIAAIVVSDVARRGIKQIPDQRRQRQLNTIRRILTAVAILLILLLNFMSDFTSFATFAGFLTAGLAVALQSVLLSLVAHTLFYGRHGVRNGDRVHVAGVTGDIVQIGMVRFYLRELHETEQGLEPTGKIVAFPNSILFQNVAFYKYAA